MNFTRNLSPNTWTLINSAAIVVVLTILYIISALILHYHIQVFPLLVTDTGVFLLSYFIYKYILEKFIYSQIKLIFKTIHTLKSPRGTKNKEIDLRQDIISNVNKEVLLWAQDKKEEIEELRKMESYRREFLGNVSHELKTPLFNIQGYVMTLLDGGIKDPMVNVEYLQRTKKNIDRMIAIIEDLESISRLRQGNLNWRLRSLILQD